MAEIYNTDRFAVLFAESKAATAQHLGLASRYLAHVLQHYRVSCAFMGAWAIYMRGGHRQTHDVDIAVQSDMDQIRGVMCLQDRVCWPRIHGTACVTIFVKVGKDFDVEYPTISNLPVFVDIVIAGQLNTPPALAEGSECIRAPSTLPMLGTVYVIQVFWTVKGKLDALSNRGDDKDLHDLIQLLHRFHDQIRPYKDDLDFDYRARFLELYESRYPGSADAIAFYRDLLGIPAHGSESSEESSSDSDG